MRMALNGGLMILLTVNSVVAVDASPLRSRPPSPKLMFVDLDPNPDVDSSVDPPIDRRQLASESLRAILDKKLDPPDYKMMKVIDFVEMSALRCDVLIDFDKNAFRTTCFNFDHVLKKEIKYPQQKGMVFSRVLSETFAQVHCEYVARGDTIFIVPARK